MKSCKNCEYFFVSNYFTIDDGELLVCCCEKNGAYLTYLKDLAPCESFEEVE